MQDPKRQFRTMDEYIAEYPTNVRVILQELGQVIKESAPEAEETISYGMPAFKLNGKSLVFFAAWKKHVGFYPAGSSAIEALKSELAPFEQAKGTIRFPLDKPIPFDLVKRIVKFRIKETERSGFSAKHVR